MAKSLKRRRSICDYERKRYLRSRPKLETRKTNRNGIIGISLDSATWRTIFPPYLGIKQRRSKSALGAAMEYNRQMLAILGDDAVLCDVVAAMALDGGSR